MRERDEMSMNDTAAVEIKTPTQHLDVGDNLSLEARNNVDEVALGSCSRMNVSQKTKPGRFNFHAQRPATPAPGAETETSTGPTLVGAAMVDDIMEVAARKRTERRANMLIDEEGCWEREW